MKLRVKITKGNGVRFISHLEYSRTINRALRRAKLPVAYSEGFNPHIKMSLASALGVGITSLSEYVEVELCEEILASHAMQALNSTLPKDIRVLACDVIDKKADKKLMAVLTGASYEIIIFSCDIEHFIKALEQYNSAAQLFFTKKSAPQKPTKIVDVKEYVGKILCEAVPNGIKIIFECQIKPAGTLKAQDILSVLQEQYGLVFDILACDITRTALYRDGKQSLFNSF